MTVIRPVRTYIRHLLILAMLLGTASPMQAQLERILESTEHYTDICMLNDTLYAVGSGIWFSTDMGFHWTAVETNGIPPGAVFVAAAADDNSLYVVSTDSVLYRRDSGSDAFQTLVHVYGTKLLASGDHVYITNRDWISGPSWHSDDRGMIAEEITAPQTTNMFIKYCEGARIWALISGGLGYSSDGGASWSVVMETNIECMEEFGGTYYASLTGTPSTIRKSTDGVNWTATGSFPQLKGVTTMYAGKDYLWAATDATLYPSALTDEVWEDVAVVPVFRYAPKFIASGDYCIAHARLNYSIMNDGQLFTHRFNFAYWMLAGPGLNLSVEQLDATESALLIYSGAGACYLGSSDGGRTWCTSHLGSFRGSTLTEFGDTLYAFSPAGREKTALYSTDRGVSWWKRPDGELGYLEAIYQYGDRSYTISRFVHQFEMTVLSSGDRGLHWKEEGIIQSEYIHPNAPVLANGSERVAQSKFAGPTYHWWYSPDAGANWTDLYTINPISFESMTYCASRMYGASDEALMMSEDGGQSWTSVYAMRKKDRLFGAAQGQLLVLAGDSLCLIDGSDHTVNIVSLAPAFAEGELQYWALNSRYLYFSALRGGDVWRVDIAAAVLDTDPLPDSAPVSFRIETVWPQPLLSAGRITIDSRSEQYLRCTLHDMLGRNVKTVYDGWISAGSVSLPITVHDVPAGPYLLRAQSGKGVMAKPLLIQ